MPHLPVHLHFPSFLRAGRAGDGGAVGGLGRDISTKCPSGGRAVGASLPGTGTGAKNRRIDEATTSTNLRRKAQEGPTGWSVGFGRKDDGTTRRRDDDVPTIQRKCESSVEHFRVRDLADRTT